MHWSLIGLRHGWQGRLLSVKGRLRWGHISGRRGRLIWRIADSHCSRRGWWLRRVIVWCVLPLLLLLLRVKRNLLVMLLRLLVLHRQLLLLRIVRL